ncbi:MAG TPA: type II toxin-antitoxin system RelE/ParE family toxin [Candidatus Acidoferrales bacterium]|jgi:plasmid maintenance system killer protein|nr:type II toxin-antitoxin system RelE/ParE family toxin [Candidatus Acidoferrales bacterium]
MNNAGKAHQLFGEQLPKLLDELNEVLAAIATRMLVELGKVTSASTEKGDPLAQHSIRVNDQWRICFRWEAGAHEVEIVDYH